MERDQVVDQEPLDTHLDIGLDPDGDQPATHEPVFVDATVREHREVPIIPANWRGWGNIRKTVRAGLAYHGHVLAVHTVRIPKYLALMLFWAVVGAGKALWRLGWWVGDPDGRPTREQYAGDTLDAWRRAREDHHAHVKHRIAGLMVGVIVLVLGGALLWKLTPWWVQLAVAAALLPTLAAFGKPRHKHIITPAVVTPRVRRLNADIVLRAYYSAGLGHPDKPGQQIMFGSPMARDRSNTGSQVAVDLPYGRGFRDALGRRESIASGLDVTVSQVFLTRDPTSNRRHRLFVADRDPLAIPAGRTPLLRLQPTDIWRPLPFGLDERGQRVDLDLMWHSLLVGAVPRAGKTFSARAIALAAALDPHVKLSVFDGKGSPDWRHFGLVADRHALGLAMTRDGDPVDILLDTLREIRADVEQRYRRLRELPVTVCPEGKLTRELARDPAARMPVRMLVLDEVQEYFDLDDRSAEIAALLVYLVKVAPGAGVIVLSATQRPSGIGKGATGTAFTSFRDNHQARFALRTSSWQVSELVLGAGAYSEGFDSSALLPTYKGVGILRGLTDDTPTVRTYLADGADAEKILTTARRLREATGTLTGMAAGDDVQRDIRDPLADVIRVWSFVDRPALHWRHLAEQMARHLPDRYGQEDADSMSALLRGLGVPSVDVKVDGEVRKGCRREAVEALLRRRQLGSGSAELVPVAQPGRG